MRFVWIGLPLVFASLGLVLACTGGPGSPDQGGATGDQNDTIQKDNSSGSTAVSATPGTAGSGTSTSSSSSSGAASVPPADLKASDYSQTCTQDSDCAAVYTGAVCSPCQCPNAAIALSAEGKYLGDSITRTEACGASTTTGVACSPCQSPAPVHCDTGSKTCQFGAKK